MLQPQALAFAARLQGIHLPRHLRHYATRSSLARASSASLTSASLTSDRPSSSPATSQPQSTVPAALGTFALKSYKPRTPGVRHLRRPINDHLWPGRPHMPLTFARKGQGIGGRNNTGRVTVRHRGGGHKRRIRMVDFFRMAPGPHVVDRIEHDPGRSAHIALLTCPRTERKSYIVAAEGMRAGDTVQSYRAGLPQELLASMGGVMDPGMLAARTAFRGNCLPVRMVPLGTQVYNLGSTKDKGAVFCRSAGTYAVVVSKEENRKRVKEVVVRLQSGEVRRVDPDACATIGVASNPHFHFRQLGKAGRKRWLGIRPTVRGLAMNACEFDARTTFSNAVTC